MHRMLNEVKAGTITPVDASLIYDKILKLQREQSRLRYQQERTMANKVTESVEDIEFRGGVFFPYKANKGILRIKKKRKLP